MENNQYKQFNMMHYNILHIQLDTIEYMVWYAT